MKKIVFIASLLIVFTACQKVDIRPRTECGKSNPEMQRISQDGSTNTTVGTPNALGGSETTTTTTTTVDPNDPENPNGGDITDPLRKKDQKDNK
nr:membrane lipoprotein lipid attachment site-containing protein [uncultured Fluviicola sp.]